MQKGIVAIIISISLLLMLPLSAQKETDQATSENQEEEKVEVLPVYPLLKGINYVRIRTKFNGIEYYKGFKDPMDTDVKEFGLDDALLTVKETGVHATKSDLQGIYDHLETQLKKAGLRILGIQPDNSKETTVIPSINLNIDILAATGDAYFALVYLTVNKWMSSWSGDDEVQQQVVIWWEKDIVVAGAQTLTGHIDKTVLSLVNSFIEHLAHANKDTEEISADKAEASGSQTTDPEPTS